MAESILDVFKIGDTLKDQNATAVQRAGQADSVLTEFIKTTDQVQANREKALTETVAAKKAVGDEVQKATETFTQAVTPLFQKREAVAQRQTQLAEMNPFKRAVVNLISINNNEDELARRQAAYDNQLRVVGGNYQSFLSTQDTILKSIENNFNDQDSVNQLLIQNGAEDVRLAMQSYGSANQMFNATLEGLNADGAVLRAKAQARVDLLSGMTQDQVNNALGEAKKNNGIAIINGVELRQGELQDAAMNWQEKRLALESRQLAVQNQRMDLAEQYERKAIMHMTAPELEAAIQNGGRLANGQVVNQALLTSAYGAMKQRQAMIVDGATAETAIPIAHQMIRGLKDGTVGANARAANLFGSIPKEMQDSAMAIAGRLEGFRQAELKARANGASAEFVRTQLPVFQQMLQDQQKLYEKMADRWGGGDKDLKAVGMAWLTGSPLNNGQAAAGLVKMARQGVPPGTKLSGPAAATLARVKQVVAAYDQGQAGQSVDALLKAGQTKKGEIPADLLGQVQKAIVSSYNANTMDSVIKATPDFARTITGPDGKPHPFSRVTREDFYNAVQIGDENGYKVIGQKLGLKPEQAKLLFSKGPNSPEFAALQKKEPDANYQQLASQLVAAQNAATLQALDHGPAATGGFKPSAAYVSLLQNPDYQRRVMNAVEGQGRSSAGDFIVHSVANSGFDQSFYNYSQSIPRSYAALEARANQITAENAARLRSTNPWDSANVAMGTIDGITPQDQQKLIGAVKQIVSKAEKGHPEAGASNLGTPGYVTASMIDSVIMNHQFDDPGLERVRRKAAQNWTATRKTTDGALERLFQSVTDITGYSTIGLPAEDRR